MTWGAPANVADWKPQVFTLVEAVMHEWRANPQWHPTEAAERMLARLYQHGYGVMLVDREAS